MSGSVSGFGGMQGLGASGTGYYSQLMASPLMRSLLGAGPAGGAAGGAAPLGGTSPLTMLLAQRILAQGANPRGGAPAMMPPQQRAGLGAQQMNPQQLMALLQQLKGGTPGPSAAAANAAYPNTTTQLNQAYQDWAATPGGLPPGSSPVSSAPYYGFGYSGQGGI